MVKQTQQEINVKKVYHFRFVNCKKPSFIRNRKRPGVAINTSTPCCKFSSWVLCRNPPVTTIDLNGTPDFDIDRQLSKTCKPQIDKIQLYYTTLQTAAFFMNMSLWYTNDWPTPLSFLRSSIIIIVGLLFWKQNTTKWKILEHIFLKKTFISYVCTVR